MLQTHPITAKRIEQAKGTIEGGAEYQHFSAKATDPGADRFGRMRNLLVKTVGKAP